MDFRPTLISTPSWIFCQKSNGIRGQKSIRNDFSLSPPSIAHGMTIGTTLKSLRHSEVKFSVFSIFEVNFSKKISKKFNLLKFTASQSVITMLTESVKTNSRWRPIGFFSSKIDGTKKIVVLSSFKKIKMQFFSIFQKND
jgi:hypothetical protein